MGTYNLKAQYGAKGDGRTVTATITIGSGSANLSATASIFTSADVGRVIIVPDAGSRDDGTLKATISSQTGTAAVLSTTSSSALTSASKDLWIGSDDTSAFVAWGTDAVHDTDPLVELVLDQGHYGLDQSSFNIFTAGVRSLLIRGPAGVGLSGNTSIRQLGVGQLYFGANDMPHKGIDQPDGATARIQTALAGATSVFLTAASLGAGHASRFRVGQRIRVAGYDMQGTGNFGYPPNPFWYEYPLITGINSGTGEITLSTPLTNTYKATWPLWASGNAFEIDQGGPATIYALDASFDCTVEIRDFVVDNPYWQSVILGMNASMTRIINNGPGIYPTQNSTFSAFSCQWSGSIEVDKSVGTMLLQDCTANILNFQSASPDLCTISGGSIKQITGSPKKLVVDSLTLIDGGGGSDAQILLGATSFGRTDEIVLTNCSGIKNLDRSSASMDGIHGGGLSATMTMTNGVIRMANADNDGVNQENPTRVFVPGTWVIFDDKLITRVVDVTQDATYTYIQTTLTGNWPFTVNHVSVHPAPKVTVRGCTGSAPILEDLNQAPVSAPLFSYSKRTYVADGSGTTAKSRPFLLGRLATAKFDITDDYAGAGTLDFHESWFDNWPVKKSDYSDYIFGPTVRMNVAGVRTVVGAAPPSNAQSGDGLPDLSSIGPLWFPGASNSGPIFSANVTGETPTITVEIITDQGIPLAAPAAFTPLRLGLMRAA